MSILSRLRVLRPPDDAACARALFARRGLPLGAPAGQQALARLLEVAAGPGTAQELAGEVAAAAAFVQVTPLKPRRTTRRVLAAAACAVAVGGTAVYASVMPSPHHKVVPLPFGVPATHHMAPAARVPPPESPRARPKGRAADRKAHQAANPAAPPRTGGR